MMASLLQTLRDKLQQEIPIIKAMGVDIASYNGTTVCLSAPLSNNINDKNVAFGGSLNAVATLAAWSLVYLKLNEANAICPIFIQKNTTHYLKPVTENFTAIASLVNPADWDPFLTMLQKKGRARIEIQAVIQNGTDTALTFTGTYVATQR
jgi:thioesterase domain-containing protein